MKVRFGKDVFEGSSEEIVAAMRKSAFLLEQTDMAYREAVAERVKLQRGKRIDPTTPDTLLDGLIRLGFCEVEEDA